VLMQCNPSDSIHIALKAIERASFRSADLIRQLLIFARKQTVAPRVDVIDNLLEPFFSTTELGEGTGLRLASVYEIV